MKILLDKDDPKLRHIAEAVLTQEFEEEWLKLLVQDMLELMKEKGAVGLAAPQIGVNKRVIVFGTAYARRRKPEIHIADTILINPTLKVLSKDTVHGYEGCLNCDDLMGEVPRAAEIEYSGYDMQGHWVSKYATGLEARILQHEIDHLDGILFFDHVENKALLTTYDQLQQRLQNDQK